MNGVRIGGDLDKLLQELPSENSQQSVGDITDETRQQQIFIQRMKERQQEELERLEQRKARQEENREKNLWYLPKGKIYIRWKDNPYQEWLEGMSRKYNELPRIELKQTVRDIVNHRKIGLFEKPSQMVMEVTNPINAKEQFEIKRMDLRNRQLILVVENYKHVEQFIKSFGKNSNAIGYFPRTKEWEEKTYYIDLMMKETGIQFDSKATQRLLEKSLIRDISMYKDVQLLPEIYGRGYHVTVEDLQNIFPNIEFYNLQEYIETFISGMYKNKALKMTYYFTEIKEYNSVWLMRKIREYYQEFMVIYEMHRRGIIFEGASMYGMDRRSKVVNFPYYQSVMNLENYEIERYITMIKRVPYPLAVKIGRALVEIGENPNKERLLYLAEQIRVIRKTYEKEDGRGIRKETFKRRKKTL